MKTELKRGYLECKHTAEPQELRTLLNRVSRSLSTAVAQSVTTAVWEFVLSARV